jgi:hypothetical protein
MIDHAVTDPDRSVGYRQRLDVALRGRVLDSSAQFCCENAAACQSSVNGDGFAAGQLSYVGDHYAATSLHRPMRILVVSMQVGDDEAPVTMTRRRAQIRDRIPETFGQRNQHMAGVTTALRVLFGGQPGDDSDGEYLDTPSGPVHVLDAYAMANSVLCSRRRGEGREGAPTVAMLRNCSAHLRTTIETLKPTIIQSQGRSTSGWSTHRAIELVADAVEPVDEHISLIRIGETQAVWCSLRHPARNWGQLKRAYLTEVALPALRQARRVALYESGL